jgi:hypothetical protein
MQSIIRNRSNHDDLQEHSRHKTSSLSPLQMYPDQRKHLADCFHDGRRFTFEEDRFAIACESTRERLSPDCSRGWALPGRQGYIATQHSRARFTPLSKSLVDDSLEHDEAES